MFPARLWAAAVVAAELPILLVRPFIPGKVTPGSPFICQRQNRFHTDFRAIVSQTNRRKFQLCSRNDHTVKAVGNREVELNLPVQLGISNSSCFLFSAE